MKTYYRLTKNGNPVDDYENCLDAQARAALMELHGLTWKGDEESGYFAFGERKQSGYRNEYEISTIKKRG